MANATIARYMLAVAAASLGVPVLAQEDELPDIIEEIVVISTKRESTLQRIPVAVSVVQAEEVEQSQVLDIKDLQFLVPSLRVTQLQTTGNTNFVIRGFGNGANNAGVEPSVGTFIDGVYRSRIAAAMFDLPNLERIEVLRGPQSTLFGKNASAGVINVVTAKPDLDDFNGSASLTYGDYDQAIVKGDVTGPLSRTVGFSLSGYYNQRDGYYENLEGGDAFNEISRYGARGQLLFVPNEDLEVRIIADYDEIDEACCGVANLLNGQAAGLAVAFAGGQVVPNSPFAYEGFYDFTPKNEFESSGVSLQFDYDFDGDVTLTSISAFRNLSRFDNADVDFTSARLIDPVSGNLTDTDIDTFTQELRLTGTGDVADWMLGAYYFDEDIEQETGIIYGDAFRTYADALSTLLGGGLPGTGPSPLDELEFALGLPGGTFFAAGQGNVEFSGLDNQAISIFGQFDFRINDFTTLTLGVNYTEDDKDTFVNITNSDVFSGLDLITIGGSLIFQTVFQQALAAGADAATATALATQASQAGAGVDCGDVPTGAPCNPLIPLQELQFLPPFVGYPNAVESGSSDDSATTWTARLAFDVSDQVNVYLGAGTGFKATSWNLSRDSRPFPGDIPALEAAGLTVNNLAPGTRFAGPEDSTVMEIGMKARFENLAVNLAVFDQEIEGFQSNIFTGVGFNLANAGKQSTTGLEIDLRWAPSEVFQGSLAATFLDPEYDSFEGAQGIDGPTDLSGTTPPGVHEVSINASGRYNFALGNVDGFIRAEYVYEDEVPTVENVPASIASREVSTWNASIGLSWQNGFEALLWGRNIGDDEYLMSAFPSVAQPGSFSGYPNQPRTFGLTIRQYFD